MKRSLIPVFFPNYDSKEERAVRDVLRSGWIGLGPKTDEFENKFADYVGAKYAVAVNSATSALHLALVAAGIKKGDEVILPALTFASTAHVVEYTGAKPVFADVDPETLSVTPETIEEKLTKKTKAIIPVHYGGWVCDMDEIAKIAKENGLVVIEDAAHACGSVYKGKKIGSISPYTCFSFHAVKNLATGDGGMITVKDKRVYEKLRRLRWVGITKDTWKRVEKVVEAGLESSRGYGWHYEINELGYKYHMNDINAAIGLVQLEKLDKANRKRQRIAKYYAKKLKGVGDIVFSKMPKNGESAQHNFVIRTKDRNKLHIYLRNNYVSTGVHYMPLHLQPYYRKKYPKVSLPVTESVWVKMLTLPVYPKLKRVDQDYIIESVIDFFD